MGAKQLSILIPARNEIFLKNTIEDILINIEADTEIIAVLDGQWANPPIIDNERVHLIYVPEAIGQRAATNLACKLSKAKYIMKVDAHCSFDKGFDRKLIEDMQDNWTVVPIMKNLHIYDWKCFKCGAKVYQDVIPVCPNCGNEMKRKMIWRPRRGTHSYSYCFDSVPHFQYWNGYSQTKEFQEDFKTGLTKTMSLQGSCFMSTREKYWELKLCDESLGSWGNQGIEVACKTWLSGGRVMVNHKTWYAHCFRTKSGVFGFPYEQSSNDVETTKNKVKDLFWNNKYDKAIHPLSWLIEKFWPVKGWNQNDLDKLKLI